MVESTVGLPVIQVLLKDFGYQAFPWTQDEHGLREYQILSGKEITGLVYNISSVKKRAAEFFHWCIYTEVGFFAPLLTSGFCYSWHIFIAQGAEDKWIFTVQEGWSDVKKMEFTTAKLGLKLL